MARGKANTRHGGREKAFQVLYGLTFSPATTEEEVRRAFLATPEAPAREGAAEPQAAGFAWELVEGVWRNGPALDAIIDRYARNWRVDRMGRVELALLRLAVFELAFRKDVPPKVAINEALELGGQFGEGKAKNFINGILDAVARALENGSLQRPAEPPTPYFR